MVERIAQRLSRQFPMSGSTGSSPPGSTGASKLERTLDDLVIQLRQQNRNAELAPEFSPVHYLALIVQIIAALIFFVGVFGAITAPRPPFKDWASISYAIMELQRDGIWVVAGMTLQGLVIALLLYARRR